MNHSIESVEDVKGNHPLIDPDKRLVVNRVRDKLRSLVEKKSWISGEDEQFMRLLAIDILDYFTQDDHEDCLIQASCSNVIQMLLTSCTEWEGEMGL